MSGKPAKPYPDFPLFPHASGQWAKKIRGKLYYFGVWGDPDAALARYLEQKEDLHAGRMPRPAAEDVTVKDLANSFLNHKAALVEAGELSPLTWKKYKTACDCVIAAFGKNRRAASLRPEDFALLRKRMSKRWGVYRLADMIQHVRSIFKHGLAVGLLTVPVCFGPGFTRPSKKTQRLHRAAQGPKLFTREEILQMIAAARPPLKAMLLLGINAGFGNADCGKLPLRAVDLDKAIIDFPRPKTGLPRRCPLWPETVAALRDALARRPVPRDPSVAGLFFLTKRGTSWFKIGGSNPISLATQKLLDRLGIRRQGRRFYVLRHTFRTIADETKDQPAVDLVMGHEVPHMSSVYRETISTQRLWDVVNHVRAWLFADKPELK